MATVLFCSAAVAAISSAARADMLDQVGVRILWTQEPNITGTGVVVAQPEAEEDGNVDQFEVNPSFALDTPIIVYVNSEGQYTTKFPNTSIGTESVHADTVATDFYGAEGPSPGITKVWNYDANFFLNYISDLSPLPSGVKVVNQSFTLTPDAGETSQGIEQIYDNYVDQFNTIIVTAVGNTGMVQLPATAYNLIAVGTYDAPASVGTADGRSKPDICAPSPPEDNSFNSYAVPFVSGVATDLVQAGIANTAGAGTASDATDNRTIKALLLNGATKPIDWSHTDTAPLDPVYGAGIVNANASYHNLAAGEFKPVASGSPTLLPSSGWNLQTLTSSSSSAATDVYPVSVNISSAHAFFTATLAWDRPSFNTSGTTAGGINNLFLYLVNTATNTAIAQSISTIDNVQQIYLPAITAGTYDIEVVKPASASGTSGWVSDSETYSLAWSTSLYGDANDDGTVNNTDLVTLLTHFSTTTDNSISTGDYNGDGTVNNTDLVALLTNFDQTIGPTVASPSAAMKSAGAFNIVAAPEPASLMLLAAGGALLLARPRRPRRN